MSAAPNIGTQSLAVEAKSATNEQIKENEKRAPYILILEIVDTGSP